MKKLLLLSSLFLFSFSDSSFCEGFSDGYEAGACYEIYGCIPPPTPICPIPDIDETTYEDGYNRGFLSGLADR